MKNENVAAEMVDILVSLHQYVPQVEVNSTMNVPGCSEPDNVKAQALHKVLLGGDQLTVVRARAAQLARDNAYDGAGRLEGFIPVCHDWHAKVCLLEVCDKVLFFKIAFNIHHNCLLGHLDSSF